MCNNFGWYLFLVEVPIFLSALKLDTGMITICSMIPFFTNYLFSVLYSTILDWFRGKVNKRLHTLTSIPQYIIKIEDKCTKSSERPNFVLVLNFRTVP